MRDKNCLKMNLNYKSYGKGMPLIILHGLFGSLDNWHSHARKLSESYQVFIIDQRNHGKSPHTHIMDYPSMAEDIANFMDQHSIREALLAGHSMGGKTAMELALQQPQRIRKLVSIDMTPFGVSGGHEEIIQALKSIDLSNIKRRKDADEQLKVHIKDFGIRQFLLKNLEPKKHDGYQWKMNLPTIEENYDKILAGIRSDIQFQGPTLFLKGQKSEYLREESLSSYQQIFPKAKIQTVTNAGHWVHAEAPEEFSAILSHFLAE